MGAAEVIRNLSDVGVHLSIDGGNLLARPASKIPADLDIQIRQYKQEIIGELTRDDYHRVYADETPSPNELADIISCVNENGICLTWCEALQDFVAFVATDDDARSVPPGFTVYTKRELFLLFNDAQPDWTPDGLRRIHAHKRAGLDITDLRNLPIERTDPEGS